jgi:hypothetical protein
MEAMVVTEALFMAARVVKERVEVSVVMAGMVEAGTKVVMAEKEETPMVDLRGVVVRR